MDKGSRPGISAAECDPVRVGNAAEAIHRDFQALVSLFEQQLADLPTDDVLRRSHLTEARLAAARGVSLSELLVGMLKMRD